MFAYCAAVRVEDGVDVGKVLIETLAELQMTHKECWLTCGMDGATWSRSLRGEAPLDFWKIRHMPNPRKFWPLFLSQYASALIVSWFADICGDYRMARADIKTKEEGRKIS